jgi:hypothetical protein
MIELASALRAEVDRAAGHLRSLGEADPFVGPEYDQLGGA